MRSPRKQLSPLARHRVARGLRQQELAVLMKVQPSTINGWESGRFRPEPDRIAKLAQHLGVDPMRVVEIIDSAPGMEAQ